MTTSRVNVKGSRNAPATPAVTAKPRIIMIQVMLAAAARLSGATVAASRTSRQVPLAPTPAPISAKASIASRMPNMGAEAIQAVAVAARTPPAPRTAMPPTIHGVRRLPVSEPWPKRGREICTK